eukprot:TRINITY_DN23421_c0_g1_i1.p1 TRINITY_DN23421_c0_g1~~TRINITY_DN23421_c0_g1_i1.p1  ORF type:complete len:467 (+),score=102.77 TRINITY_DN23421_c0_g1_i1:252-1652(+)
MDVQPAQPLTSFLHQALSPLAARRRLGTHAVQPGSSCRPSSATGVAGAACAGQRHWSQSAPPGYHAVALGAALVASGHLRRRFERPARVCRRRRTNDRCPGMSRHGRIARAAGQTQRTLPEALEQWAGEESVEKDKELREAVMSAASALREDPEAWQTVEDAVAGALEGIERRLRQEKRTLADLLGTKAAASLEKSVGVGLSEGFSEEDLRAALRTPAAEKAVGAVLKDGIFEFLQTVDLLGNAVNRLPILGPLRQQVVDGLRKEVDRVLGAQINQFLGRNTRMVAERTLLPFLTARANREMLASSAEQFVRYILQRRVEELVPADVSSDVLRQEILVGLKTLDIEAVGEGSEAVRRLLRKRPDPAANPAYARATRPLSAALDDQWQRFVDAEDSDAAPVKPPESENVDSKALPEASPDMRELAAHAVDALMSKAPDLAGGKPAAELADRARLEARIAQVLSEELQ